MTSLCGEMHQLCNRLERFSFPFDDKKIPLNGIYILFEVGEKGHEQDRIVRIGTHTGGKQLRSRLKQHFLNENKDRSIFRKNIGRALLNKSNEPFLKYWELDLTTRKAKDKYKSVIDFDKQKVIENQVSSYIQNNLSFVVFRIDDKNERLAIESKIISTVSLCKLCRPSFEWLGLSSPKDKIRESGFWLVNELYKTPLDENDLN